jgi:peptidoglycan hydrolase-like protein with peptidoglycan-binding domain
MRLSQINLGYLAGFAILALVLALPATTLADDKYAACGGLNDFLSYSKCVAEIDSQLSGQPTVLVGDTKAQDGDFSLKIGDGSGKVYALNVTLSLTASATTTQVSISKDSNFGFADRQQFSAKKLWTLDDSPNETQYVYVKFFDKDGSALDVVAAPVIYIPRQIDAVAEAAAKLAFAKIYQRAFNDQNQFDNAWLSIAVYEVDKGTFKDLSKEQTALAKFVAVYKKTPKTAQDWLLIHAIAYTPDNTTAVTGSATTTPAITSTAAAVCVAKPIKQVLDVGSKGTDVQNLQDVMKCAGYLAADIKTDGVFDKKLEAAVQKFQTEYKLACKDGSYCGHVGPATAKKIAEVYQAGGTTAVSVSSPAPAVIVAKIQLKLSRNLTVGSQGADVKALQQFLALDSKLYPEGRITGKFDTATENAIKKFQEKYSLACKDGTYCGYVGSATRAKLQEVSGQ